MTVLIDEEKPNRYTICVDFDGVLNTYSGWKGATELDGPAEGAVRFLANLREDNYRVVVFTTRPHELVYRWLRTYNMRDFVDEVTAVKPPAVCYIDDRAVCHRGDFDETLKNVREFRPHWVDKK